MKNITLLTAMLLSSTALAADLPSRSRVPVAPVQTLTWEGYYAGVHVGLQRDRHHWTMQGYGVSSTSSYQLDLNKSGLLAGIHAGYNVQSDNFVYGIEADADWRNARRYGAISLKTSDAKIGPEASLRLRTGLALDRVLLFTTGGLAIADVQHRTGCEPSNTWCTPAENTGNLGKVRFGWTVGGGAEWLINNKWSLRTEYRYSDFGKLKADTSEFWTRLDGNPRNYTDSLTTKSQTVRIGLTYHYGK